MTRLPSNKQLIFIVNKSKMIKFYSLEIGISMVNIFKKFEILLKNISQFSKEFYSIDFEK